MCAQKAITRATWQSNNLWENSKTKIFLLYMLLYYIHIKYTTYLCIRTYRSYLHLEALLLEAHTGGSGGSPGQSHTDKKNPPLIIVVYSAL